MNIAKILHATKITLIKIINYRDEAIQKQYINIDTKRHVYKFTTFQIKKKLWRIK